MTFIAKELFINISPKLFEHVLAHMIDFQYPFKYQYELDYYSNICDNINKIIYIL